MNPQIERVPGTLRLLIAGPAELAEECRSALGDRRAVIFHAPTHHEALAIARDRQPHIVFAAVQSEADGVDVLSREMHDVVPGVIVVGAYQPTAPGETRPDGGLVIGLLRAEVADFLRRPVASSELTAMLERLFAPRDASGAPGGVVVAFVSNKGGVGKSTLAANVATALAATHPGQVLLIDASLQLGVCAAMLGLQPETSIVDATRERDRLDEALLRGLTATHESGLRLLAAPADALEAADITDEGFARVLAVARRAFEYVVVDTFPMLDTIVIAALDASDAIFVVMQGTAPCVGGVARLLPVLDGLGFARDRRSLVLNRNHRRFLGELSVDDIEQSLGDALAFRVPYDRGVLVSMNTGVPRVQAAPWWNGFRRQVRRIAADVEGRAAGRATPPDPAAADARMRLDAERRRGSDRRIRDIGRPEGDRRSGIDRRLRGAVGSDARDSFGREGGPRL